MEFKCCFIFWSGFTLALHIKWKLTLEELPTFIETNHEKMVPKQREKGGKKEFLNRSNTFDVLCNFKSLASLQTFKSTCGGKLFLLKLQVSNCNCSEKKNAPLEVFLRFYIRVNASKSQNASNICPLLQRQLLHTI